ncbi:MAG TPA: sigma 54-interacting transcriptional regulator [Symbiobacteriaceae bacterium]|nr:sigma 54-interacting transcriptional regulator [Symbiobacteriaceae bacterium]
MTQRWRVATENRVGMARDILSVVSGAGLDVEAMEVLPGLGFFRLEGELTREVRDRLLALPGVVAIDSVPLMPQEEKQREVDAVLQAVSDGVLVVRAGGKVAGLNPAAERILAISESRARGMDAAEVLGTDRLTREPTSFDNEEVRAQTPRGRLHYVASGRVLGDSGGLVLALKSIQEARELAHSLTRPRTITFEDLTFRSRLMADVIKLAKAASRVDATVLLQGESGTGKEIFARAIHDESGRSGGAFVPINCAALPETLLESELFGYEEGSFTGAKRGGKQGIFEFAGGGTVFLDEIAELPAHLQAKLLRVLQEGRVRRVGGREEIPVDVRLIAATNRNLRSMVAERQFRDDLYYRLNVIPIVIPPLRERREDIDVLTDHLIAKWSVRFGRPQPVLTDEARRRLREYPWPGNVRELENVVERALALAPGHEIGSEYLMLEGQAPAAVSQGSLKERLAEVERQILAESLTRTGSARRTAEALGVSHTTILNKLHKLGLSHLLRE